MVDAVIFSDAVLATVVNDQTLTSDGTIIHATGTLSSITNNAAITSTLGTAIVSAGYRSTVLNAGQIFAAQDGILASADYSIVVNMNDITGGDFGVRLVADYQKFTNNDNVTSEEGVAVKSTGIFASITNNSLLIGGSEGILSTGDFATIVNADRLICNGSDSTTVVLGGDNAVFVNSYTLWGGTALRVSGDNTLIMNSGVITSTNEASPAIDFVGSISTTFVNYGTIDAGSDLALQGSNGSDTITNTGKINGDVGLDNGNDIFDNRGGEVGVVRGGRGNDSYYLGDVQQLVEAADQGVDTVYTTSNGSLRQNFERLVLLGSEDCDGSGNESRNRITANSGDNVLIGAEGRDIFVFLTDSGADTIADFGLGRDRIDLSDVAGLRGYGALKSHMTEVGGSVVIDLMGTGAGLQLTLNDTTLAELHKADFIL